MIGKLITGSVEGVGNAASDVGGTIWGSKRERESAVHNEQMGVLAHFAPDFAGGPPATWWDSFVDRFNRLPRLLITFGIIGLFPWAAFAPVTFAETMQTLAVVPDVLWIMMLTIIAFWFGGRFIKRDLGKPRVSKQQLELARESVARRTRVTEGPSRWRRKPGCYRPCRFIGRPTIRIDCRRRRCCTIAGVPDCRSPMANRRIMPHRPVAGVDAMIAALIEHEGLC